MKTKVGPDMAHRGDPSSQLCDLTHPDLCRRGPSLQHQRQVPSLLDQGSDDHCPRPIIETNDLANTFTHTAISPHTHDTLHTPTDSGDSSHALRVTVHRTDSTTDAPDFPVPDDGSFVFTDTNSDSLSLGDVSHHSGAEDQSYACTETVQEPITFIVESSSQTFTDPSDWSHPSTDTAAAQPGTDGHESTHTATAAAVHILHTNEDMQHRQLTTSYDLDDQSETPAGPKYSQSQSVTETHSDAGDSHHQLRAVISNSDSSSQPGAVADMGDFNIHPQTTTDARQRHEEQASADTDGGDQTPPPAGADDEKQQKNQEPPTVRVSERTVIEADDGDQYDQEDGLHFLRSRREGLRRQPSQDAVRKSHESQEAILRYQRSQTAHFRRQLSRDSGLGRQVSQEGGSERSHPPLRRLSDLRNLTLTLGLQIHGSILNLATEKSRKQVTNTLPSASNR